ncbi:MAG: methyl-accepting chemotaxis protein [Acetobacteraceae bacterium]
MGIRGRLVMAFLSLAALIGVTGGAGLWFANQMGVGVTVLADTALPLLRESQALAGNAASIRATAKAASEAADPATDLAELAALRQQGREALDRLRGLAERSGTALDRDLIATSQANLFRDIDGAIRLSQQRLAALQAFNQGITRFEQARTAMQRQLAEVAGELEQRMVSVEDSAKTSIQGGSATIDSLGDLIAESMNETFPALQGVYRLMRDLAKLEELAKSLTLASAPAEVDPIEKETQRTIRAGGNALQRLASRMRSDEHKVRLLTTRQGLATIQAGFDGKDGLFAAQRAAIAAGLAYGEAQRGIATVEDAYRRALAAAGEAAERLELQSEHDAQTIVRDATLSLMGVVGLGIVLALLLGVMIASRLANPLTQLSAVMRALAAGERPDVPGLERRDEIGRMAAAVLVFKENAEAMERLRAEQDAERERGEYSKRDALMGMADKIEGATGDALSQIGLNTASLTRIADQMTALADRTGTSAQDAVTRASQALGNIQTVATAAEELAASIREISGQVARSSDMVGEAVHAGGETRDVIENLNEQVGRIGTVADMISEIAAKTNLLALNATIEAARAGDAGKGFAVVASEVKQLATQTARSTEEIGQHINAVRAATTAAVVAVRRIETTIGEVNAIAGSIAAAVEEQGAATAEIARNVTETATAAEAMTTLNTEVASDAQEARQHAEQVLDSIKRLDGTVEELKHGVIRIVRTSTAEVDRRAAHRFAVDLACRITVPDEQVAQAKIADLSDGGARIVQGPSLSVGTAGILECSAIGAPLRFAVRHAGIGELRLAFDDDQESLANVRSFLQRAGTNQAA